MTASDDLLNFFTSSKTSSLLLKSTFSFTEQLWSRHVLQKKYLEMKVNLPVCAYLKNDNEPTSGILYTESRSYDRPIHHRPQIPQGAIFEKWAFLTYNNCIRFVFSSFILWLFPFNTSIYFSFCPITSSKDSQHRVRSFVNNSPINNTAWKASLFGIILVRIFPHSDWIRTDSPYLCVFSPNTGKRGPE